MPEDHTDFIFAAVGEQYGFVGAALVLSLYALLIWRTLRILTMSKDLFGSLVAGGVAAMLMFQVFVNVGMTIGIMPITGVTLPLMSYGGSSVITTLSGRGPAAIDLRPGARLSGAEGPRAALLDTDQCPPTTPDRQLCKRLRGSSSGLRPHGTRPASIPKDWIKLKKQVLVSVDRAETRVALLEASGTPAASRSSANRSRKRAQRCPGGRLSHS